MQGRQTCLETQYTLAAMAEYLADIAKALLDERFAQKPEAHKQAMALWERDDFGPLLDMVHCQQNKKAVTACAPLRAALLLKKSTLKQVRRLDRLFAKRMDPDGPLLAKVLQQVCMSAWRQTRPHRRSGWGGGVGGGR